MSSLMVFNRFHRLEIQSVLLVFSTPLVNWRHLNLLTGSSPPPPPFPVWTSTVPEFIDPVFTKTSPKRSFSMNENERFGLVFAKTGFIKSDTGVCIYAVCNGGGGEGDRVVWRASTGVLHCVFDQILNLQNCFTTPNKNRGGAGASNR